MGFSYKEAGVDIEKGKKVIGLRRLSEAFVRKRYRPPLADLQAVCRWI